MRFFWVIVFFFLNLSATMKRYVMDNDYFSLNYPSSMKMERSKEGDKDGIYKVVFLDINTKTSITVKYYSPKSGRDYKKFIEQQTGVNTPTERYEKPKNINVGGKKATQIIRYLKEFEDISSPSSPSYWLKEKIVVIPANKGFYTVIFSALEKEFDKKSKIFDSVLKSLKTKY